MKEDVMGRGRNVLEKGQKPARLCASCFVFWLMLRLLFLGNKVSVWRAVVLNCAVQHGGKFKHDDI